MLSTLAEPFTYGYMLNAMWVSALVGGVCAFLSAYLMLKGWSLIGDALSHSVVPGVAGAYILGVPFALGAFLAAMLWLSVLICMAAMLTGTYASFWLDSAPAPSIILTLTAMFLLAFARRQIVSRRAITTG